MAFNVSYIFQAIDNFSQVAESIKNKFGDLSKKAGELNTKFEKMGEKLQDVGTSLSLKLSTPLGLFAGTALYAAGSQEKLNAQMENLIGNADKAKVLFGELEKIKMVAPIDVGSVDEAAVKLLVMGSSVDKVSDTINRFSKIAAGSGESLDNLVEMFSIAQSSPEGMSRAIMMLGRRIPILEEMQKVFKETFGKDLTTKQIKQLAAEGKIDISVLEAALKRLTDQGGKFADSFSNQAKTLAGSFQILRNNFHRFQESIGFAISKSVDLSGVIATVNDVLKDVVHFVEDFAKAHPTITKYIVIFGAIAVAVGPLLVALGSIIVSVTTIARLFAIFTFNPFFIGAKTILKLVAAFMYLYNTFEIVRKATDVVVSVFQAMYRAAPMLTQALMFMVGAIFMLWKANMLATTSALIFKGAMAALPVILAAARGAMWLLNAAFAANPMGLMVVGITALTAGIVYLLDKLGILDQMLTWIKDKATALGNQLKQVFTFDIGGTFDNIMNKVSGVFGGGAPLIGSGSLAANQNVESKSSVEINVKGAPGVVESVKSKTDGNTNLKLTQNMAYGGY